MIKDKRWHVITDKHSMKFIHDADVLTAVTPVIFLRVNEIHT